MRNTNWLNLAIHIGKGAESINDFYEPHREMIKFLKELESVCKFLHKHGKELPLTVHKHMERAILKELENAYVLYDSGLSVTEEEYDHYKELENFDFASLSHAPV